MDGTCVRRAGPKSAFMAGHDAPIEVFNRYTGKIEEEAVYGERWLRWTYATPAGRLALGLVVKRVWFSRWYGWRMSRASSAKRIAPFVRRYGLDASEFDRPLEAYASFNDFFSRGLMPGARPICAEADVISFPADGRHLGIARIGSEDRVYAKGQSLDLSALLGDRELARRFAGGALVISRLCPVDYHRFHFPCAGEYTGSHVIAGPLFSVSPIALRRRLDYLASNKRSVTVLEKSPAGGVVIIEIGATCVGSIVQTSGAGTVKRGAEKGMFRFGGSCVVTVFEPGRVLLADDLLSQTRDGRELYAHMGDSMGQVVSAA